MPDGFALSSFLCEQEKEVGFKVLSTSRKQRHFAMVYSGDKPLFNTIFEDGGLNKLAHEGTIMGYEVKEPTYFGETMPTKELQKLYDDPYAFEKVTKAMSGGLYTIAYVFQSYGPQYNNWKSQGYGVDASGPLHVYFRHSHDSDDHYHFYWLTSNDQDPEHGSQRYTINNWYEARGHQWYYRGTVSYGICNKYKGYHLSSVQSDSTMDDQEASSVLAPMGRGGWSKAKMLSMATPPVKAKL